MTGPEPSGTLRATLRLSRPSHQRRFELDVQLEAPPGITILFGPSGSGKSTVLSALAGLVRPTAGRITVGDALWFDADAGIELPVHRRGVAYVFQQLALFPHLSAVRNVAYGLPRTLPRRERDDRARTLLARLNVAHLAERKPRTFSGGEAQRVALARALAISPRLILLDEPFSALDRELRLQLIQVVRALVNELGVPLIQVTHDHDEARALGDRVVRLADGRVVQVGSCDEVLGAPVCLAPPAAAVPPTR
jgi:molybdate transport system ATP-binding protein